MTARLSGAERTTTDSSKPSCSSNRTWDGPRPLFLFPRWEIPDSFPLLTPVNPFASINALACPAPGSCVADGTFQSASNERLGVILQQNPGGWTAQQAPLPADESQGSAGVDLGAGSLSCPAVGECTAVGGYQTEPSTNTQIGQAGMVLTQSDGSWIVANQQAWPDGYVPGAPNSIVYSQLFGVSCATADTC